MRTRLGWIAPITAIAALALGMAVSRAAPHTERSGPVSAPVRGPAGLAVPAALARSLTVLAQRGILGLTPNAIVEHWAAFGRSRLLYCTT